MGTEPRRWFPLKRHAERGLPLILEYSCELNPRMGFGSVRLSERRCSWERPRSIPGSLWVVTPALPGPETQGFAVQRFSLAARSHWVNVVQSAAMRHARSEATIRF